MWWPCWQLEYALFYDRKHPPFIIHQHKKVTIECELNTMFTFTQAHICTNTQTIKTFCTCVLSSLSLEALSPQVMQQSSDENKWMSLKDLWVFLHVFSIFTDRAHLNYWHFSKNTIEFWIFKRIVLPTSRLLLECYCFVRMKSLEHWFITWNGMKVCIFVKVMLLFSSYNSTSLPN